MNVDERLLKFKSEVGENIGNIETNKNELSNNINTLVSINNNVASQLNNALKSDGGEMASSMIESINQTATELNQSLESNLGKTITDCKSLNDGIASLENILASYNSKISQLNNMEEDNPKRGTIQIEINKLKEEFTKKNQELCILHDSILGISSTASTVEKINVSDSSIDFSFNAGFTGTDLSNSIFYEKDGIIYQKVIPFATTEGLSATYIIAYDKNAILNAVGTDSKIGQQAISFLNSKVANSDKASALWKMFGRSYEKEDYADIATVMNVILEDSYEANNCQSVSDYATVAATVATNSLVHMKYDGATTSYTKGFNQVLTSGYDCIGFTTWAYYQGLSKVYNLEDNANVGLSDVTCNGIYYHYGEKIENMSNEERANIKPGSIVTRYGHIGMVIGTTEKNGEDAIVIAHSAGTNQGTVTGTWPVSNLTNQWVKVMTPEDMTRRAIEGDFNNTD